MRPRKRRRGQRGRGPSDVQLGVDAMKAVTLTGDVGCYLGYLRAVSEKLDAAAGYPLEDSLRRLSCFNLEILDPLQRGRSLDGVVTHVLAVARNLLTRGLPTLPSLKV